MIEEQLSNIQKIMTPLIKKINESSQKNSRVSLSILSKAIGRSIKVNCEKVIELLIDDLL